MKTSLCLLTVILAGSLAKADKPTPTDSSSPADQLRSQALGGLVAYELAYYGRDDEEKDKNKDQDNDKERGPGKGKGKAKGKAKGLREKRDNGEQGNEKAGTTAPVTPSAPASAATPPATPASAASPTTTAPTTPPVTVPGAKPQVVTPAPASAPGQPPVPTPATTPPATPVKAQVPSRDITTAATPPTPAPSTPSAPARSPAQIKSDVNRSFNHLSTLASERKASATAGLAAISKETGVPVATLEEQRKKHGSSYGGLFMANELAKATGKPADAFYRQRAQGRDWDRMAEENKVELATVLPKLQRIEQSMEAARKK